MATTTPSEIIGLLAALAQVFFSNNPTAEEVIAFLEGALPAIQAIQSGTTGTVPAFRVGSVTVGPIPITPIAAAAPATEG